MASYSSSSSSLNPSSSFMNMDNFNSDRSNSFTWGLSDQLTDDKFGIEFPKFRSFAPSSLPISPSPVSPSSYLVTTPPAFSPSIFLDSPAFFSTSNVLPSPTTGAIAAQNNLQDTKREQSNYIDFSFQPHPRPSETSVSSTFQSSSNIVSVEQPTWNLSKSMKQPDFVPQKTEKSEFGQIQSFSTEMAPLQSNIQGERGSQSAYPQYNQPSQYMRENRKVDDGYNWRKYGQKQVKGSENPRSYYKCTYPNCPTKKKVERSLDGEITEIVYKGNHNHPKPQSTRRSSSHSLATNSEMSDQSVGTLGNDTTDSFIMQDETSGSTGDDVFEQGSPLSNPDGENENETDAKRWKGDNENEGIIGSGSRTVREPRIVVQTTSDIDILDDGYRWRKYGQKVVKGNPNPRSYYKCTTVGCPVRKHVERASHDLRAVITTYEGKHNHDVPAARGSGYSMSRPSSSTSSSTSMPIPIRPSAVATQPTSTSFPNSFRPSLPAPGSQAQALTTLEMLQGPSELGYSGYGKPFGSFMNQAQFSDLTFPRAKEESKDESFLDSFLS
ncbi:hypothetical protein SLEP1_g18059 [Rubroshorea leprosula]|uniref:WRKY domain-containing protein n=1 Tax=Rubroshorea leprosula TaxID=152421 RepID=A0AAV5J576_9ROSI|nr:hypothetical protein SLEP1_g18059 [Rubroshorea leprosula]